MNNTIIQFLFKFNIAYICDNDLEYLILYMTTEIIQTEDIKSKIFTLRSVQIMLDRDLAELYIVETKALNQAVKRNIERFPAEFMFQLDDSEKFELVTNCYRFRNLKHSTSNPYAFTEQGVAMLSAILKSETAIKVSVQIINAFVSMRRFLVENGEIFHRLEKVEYKLLETGTKIENILIALETKQLKPQQGIFFDNQLFDAYSFVSELIRSADESIYLIDNYIDDTVLTIFTKRKAGVKVKIFTKSITQQNKLDIKKYNSQYEPIEIIEFNLSHDRFLIIDEKELYHFGASLKDLGKRWFAFSKMDINVVTILERIKCK